MEKHFLQPPTCYLLNRAEICTHWNITNVKTGLKWWSFNTWKWTCRTQNCWDWVVACCETDEMIWMMREMENNCWSDEPSSETILTPETRILCKDRPGACWRQREGIQMTPGMRILPCSLWVTGSWRLSWCPTPFPRLTLTSCPLLCARWRSTPWWSSSPGWTWDLHTFARWSWTSSAPSLFLSSTNPHPEAGQDRPCCCTLLVSANWILRPRASCTCPPLTAANSACWRREFSWTPVWS